MFKTDVYEQTCNETKPFFHGITASFSEKTYYKQ